MLSRRVFLVLAAAGLAGGAEAQSVLGKAVEPYFADWLSQFYAQAEAAGLSRTLLDREFAGLSPDPRVAVLDAGQPEFSRPVSAYVEGAISPARIAEGRAKRSQTPLLGRIEADWGVPRDILIGVWAMESGFGAHQGDLDVLRCLATLAQGRRRAWANAELIAALKMIAERGVSRERLRGSWAGAMGQTQILPSVYLETSVSASGSGRPDIWGSAPDALASAAHLLAKNNWRRGEGWAVEVIPPAGFDFSLTESVAKPFAWWAQRGLRRASEDRWSSADAAADAMLLLPSGAAGPAFLALPNHFVIRSYNNSIAYALAVGLLADRFAGGGPLTRPWPREVALSLTQRMAAQSALAKLGFDPGPIDGMIGFGVRKALRAWQQHEHLTADGYLSPAMVARLSAAARR